MGIKHHFPEKEKVNAAYQDYVGSFDTFNILFHQNCVGFVGFCTIKPNMVRIYLIFNYFEGQIFALFD